MTDASDLTVRRYREADDDRRLRELNETALRSVDTYAEDAPDDDLRDVQSIYLDAGGEFLVGILDGTIVAIGALSPVDDETIAARVLDDEHGPTAEVTRMRVDPAHQGRGFGTRILASLEERAREAAFETLVLDTTERQTGARRLYEKFGYERRDSFEWREYTMLLYRNDLA